VIAFVGWWGLLSPAQEALNAATDEVRRSVDASNQDRRRLEELAAIARRSNDLERRAAALAIEAPPWSVDRIVTAVESAALRTGATLDAVSPAEAQHLSTTLTAHPLTLTLSGTYDQMRAALARLQHLEPRITIGSLSIIAAAPGQDLSMVIAATAYAATPPPGTPRPTPTSPPTPDPGRDPFAPVIPPTPTPRPRPITLTAVVVVDRVGLRAITMLVRGRTYRAPVGGSVADGVRFVRAVSRRCADLRYGTRTTRACEGESVVLTRKVWPEGRPASPPQEPRAPS
jgi:Tfp pilus assembly protein PilO